MPLNHCKITFPSVADVTLAVSCVLFNGARMSKIRVNLSDLHIAPGSQNGTSQGVRYYSCPCKLKISIAIA
jgi:hypothetical protein